MAGLDFLLNLRANASGFNQGIDGAKFAVNALVGALAAIGVGLGIKELADAADSYTNLSAQVQMATKEGGDFNAAMASIHQVALSTNSTLDATAGLFNRLNTVGKEMGLTQQQALDMTASVTKAIQMGGGSAQASEAAVTQFIQAMQGGVLRGEEFNSIMENGYGLAEVLAKGLGVTTGELRKMAEAGELTAERVLGAIESQKDSIDATYAQLPTTIGNALQRIQTSWQILIGEMDQANGVSAQVAQWLVYVADNLGIVKTFLDDVGEGFVWFGDQLKKIDPSTIDAFKGAVIQAYETVKTLVSTIGSIGVSIAGAFDATASMFGPFIDSFIYGGKEVGGFTKILDGLRIGLALISDGLTGVNIVFKLLLAGAQFLEAGVLSLKAKLIGFFSDDWATQVQKQSDALFAQAEENGREAKKLAIETKSATQAALEDVRKTQQEKNQENIADSEATLAELLKKEQDHYLAYKAISDERIRLEQALHDARKSGNQEAIDKALAGLSELDKKEQEYLKQSQDYTAQKVEVAQELLDATLIAEDGKQKAIDETSRKSIEAKLAAQGLAVEFDAAGKAIVKAMEPAKNSIEGLIDATTATRKAATALKLDLYELKNGITETFNNASKDVSTLADGIESLGFAGQRSGEVIYEAWKTWLETAKSQNEVTVATSKLEEFGKKGQLSTEQVKLGMEAIKAVVRELPAELTEVEKAFERLGIQTKKQLKLQADLALEDFETIRQSGEATQADLQKAYEKTIQKAHASGDAQSIAMANAKAASLGLEVQISETGDVSVKSMNEVADAVERVSHRASHDGARGFRDMANAAREMGEEAKHSIEQWNDALTAQQNAAAEASKNNGPKGGEVKSYSKADIEGILKSRGYSDKDAKKYAESLYIQGVDADKGVMSKNLMTRDGASTNKLFDQLHSQGLTATQGSAKIDALLSQFSVGSSGTSSSAPEKTVNYNLSLGGQTVNLTGPVGQEDAVNELFNQLESIKKRS